MVPWLQVYSNLPTHPKIYKLSEAIKQSNYATVGILVCVWSWATINASTGDLSAYPNPRKVIESAVGWTNKKINLYQALIDTKWIDVVDGKIMIHNWKEYGAEGFKGKKEKEKEQAAKRQQKFRDKQKSNVTDNGNDFLYDNVTDNAIASVTDNADVTGSNALRNSYITPYNTIQNNTIHNSTLPLSPLTPPEGSDVTCVTGTERERREENTVNLSEEVANDKFDLFKEYQSYWCNTTGIANVEDIPKQAYTASLRAAVNDIEPELVKRIINKAVEKDSPSAWFAKVIDNLISDGITTSEQYAKRYGGNKQSDSGGTGGSFDTDEFFELAVKRTYEKFEKNRESAT